MNPIDQYDLTLIQDNPHNSSWGDIRIKKEGDMFTFNISPSRKHPREGYGYGSMHTKENMARLFLYLAKNLGIDTDMLADLAQHIDLGGHIRGAGGIYDHAQSIEGLGKPLMDIFELVAPPEDA